MEEELISQLEAAGNYRVIKRFEPVDEYYQPDGQDTKIGIYLDTETTGLDPDSDKIIELAMVPFQFHASGKIYRILPAYNGFQDPRIPIPEEITKITGITDEMVAGKSLDLGQVASLLSGAVIVIAHNAKFDRPFVEGLYEGFKQISWGCSIADINWQEEGVGSVSLEFLAYKYGFFFEGHRATIDCQAGIHVLSHTLPTSGEPVLKRLLDSARRTDYRLWATDSPFEKKDDLKMRGYRWSSGEDGKPKAWYTDVPEVDLEGEMAYLSESIYARPVKELSSTRITARLRYSNRI